MSMSRKDYRAVADDVKTALDYTDGGKDSLAVARVARSLADTFKRDNSNFRYDTFFSACGLDYNGELES